jgi:hypothetical protein
METQMINTIEEYEMTFAGYKNKDLKQFCKQNKIKQSKAGVSNRLVLLENIYEHIFGCPLETRFINDHYRIVMNMTRWIN